jgi:ribonuclease R
MNVEIGQKLRVVINTNKKGTGTARSIRVKDKFAQKIEIRREDLKMALPGDICEIQVTGKNIVRGNDYGYLAKVLSIDTRKQEVYAGHIEEDNGKYFFVSHDSKMYIDFLIEEANLNGAKVNDKVVVSLASWVDMNSAPRGVVEKVLGKRGESSAEMASYSEEKGFKVGFSKEIEEESEAVHERGIQDSDIEGRRDFRAVTTFTIDPIDAKDFDDAISVNFLPDGNVEVGVHIADVSHYLKNGMKMNDEAEKRTTSVYLVDRVVPMLPEVLSNDLCSLVEAKDRLTMAAVFVIDANGVVIKNKNWFGETVICSHKRFSYEEAQEIMDKQDGIFLKELNYLNNLAKKFSKERKENGAITMETEEVKFKLDEKGVPIEVYRKVRKDAHKLVEEFMLLANISVAEYIHELGSKNHVGIYRVHDAPDPDRMLTLSTFLYNLGYDAPYKDDTISQKDLNKVMAEIESDPNKSTIQTQIVRSMQKAIYTTENIGHYGLAFDYYSHFTSPIRRYPDVMIHRLMKKYLKGRTTDERDTAWYEAMCLRCSEREKDAAEAERSSVKYKQVEYMSMRIGQEVTALVSGLSPHGIYLEDEHSKCEGMIKFSNLGGDNEYFELDDKQFIVKGDKGTIIRMGDVYKVRVEAANLEEKTIDYKIVELVRQMTPRKRI